MALWQYHMRQKERRSPGDHQKYHTLILTVRFFLKLEQRKKIAD
jgi:hypothetical protein